MELRQLEAFVEAARQGSISRAAQTLYLAQPSLTQRVRALEQELGQQLLVRSRQGVQLTRAGRLFLPRAEAALAALRRGATELKELRELQDGRLALAAAPDAATYLLPAALERFRRAHPVGELSLHTGCSFAMAAMVATEQVERALVSRPVRLPELLARCLYAEPLPAVAAPDHPLVGCEHVSLEAFAAAGLVVREAGSFLFALTLGLFEAGGATPSSVLAPRGRAARSTGGEVRALSIQSSRAGAAA